MPPTGTLEKALMWRQPLPLLLLLFLLFPGEEAPLVRGEGTDPQDRRRREEQGC